VLGDVKGALAWLGGCAALDASCAPCSRSAFSDGRRCAAHHEASHRWPQFLRRRSPLSVFCADDVTGSHIIYLGDIDGGPPRKLVASPLSAAFVPPDHLLFMVEDALMAARFNIRNA
jgi:hypothetical protein